jgi:PAS domain S-box-containing protein
MTERQHTGRSTTRHLPVDVEHAAVNSTDAIAEAALRESEAHYRHLAEFSPHHPWMAGPDGRCLDVSQRWLNLTGLTREQALGVAWEEVVHPDDLLGVSAAWEHSVRSGEPYDTEHRVRLANGSYHWMRARAFQQLDEKGQVLRWFGYTEDVHDRRVAEDALRASEERFQLATGAVVGSLYDYDVLADRVVHFGGAEQVLGFGVDEVPPSASWWIARIHPDDLAYVLESARPHLEGGANEYTHEYRFKHKAGHYVHISDHGRVARNESGRPIRLLGGITDITDRVQLEQDRERLLADLQWEESRLKEIFDAASTFFAVFRGPDMVYEFVNDAYYEIAGRRDLLGRRMLDVFPESRDQGLTEVVNRVLSEGRPWAAKEARIEIHPQDGGAPRERFLDLTFTSLTESDGTRSGIVAHGMDVTQHVLARREIERLLAESERLSLQEQEARVAAEKATKARDEILRVVSHELGGPLSVINIAVDGILESESPSAESIHENAAILKRAAEWMERLLRDLADVASIESGQFRLLTTPETPRALVTQAAEMFAGPARSHGIALDAITAPGLPVVVVDPARVLQALSNLVTNAMKATKPGGRIRLLAELDPAGVCLTVEDTGSGIAPENLPHMFDRAWQQRHHTNAGLGLGLAIVRGIVEAHGGEIYVDSTPGEGSRFSFTVRPRIDNGPSAIIEDPSSSPDSERTNTLR